MKKNANKTRKLSPTEQDRQMDLLGVLEEKLPGIRMRKLTNGAVQVDPISFDQMLELGQL